MGFFPGLALQAYLPENALTGLPNMKKPRRKSEDRNLPVDYIHPNFKRGRKDLLPQILRKLREHVEVNASSILSPNASSAAGDDEEEGQSYHSARRTLEVPEKATQYVDDCLADDAWKAILGPVLSNERSVDYDTPQENMQHFARSEVSTRSASPDNSIFNCFADHYLEIPRFQCEETPSPVQVLDKLMKNLPKDPGTLRSLLQQTQLLTSQIQELLFGACLPQRGKIPGHDQLPGMAEWSKVGTGWNGPLPAHQQPFNNMNPSALGPFMPDSTVPAPPFQSTLPF